MPSVSLPSGKGSENSCTVHTLTAAARRNTSLREGGGLGRSPKTEGASGQETNLTTGGGTSPGLKFSHAPSQESAGFNRHRVSAVMSRCQPISKPSAYSPLAPSVTAKATGGSPAVPAPSRRELWGLYLATLVCCSGGSASCESLSRLRRQLPLAREPGSVPPFGFTLQSICAGLPGFPTGRRRSLLPGRRRRFPCRWGRFLCPRLRPPPRGRRDSPCPAAAAGG